MGRVMYGSGRVMSSCRVRILGPHLTHHMVRLGLVMFGFFMCNFQVDLWFLWFKLKIWHAPDTLHNQVFRYDWVGRPLIRSNLIAHLQILGILIHLSFVS